MQYRPEIDGIRAVAVLPVILFHAGIAGFSGGFVGVDVFFVISGYLISTIIFSELEANSFSIAKFYVRRARRILPALFSVVLFCIPLAWLYLPPRDLIDFGQSLVAVSTFTSNILFRRESGYFDTAAEIKPLLHTWSLAVEEQYYVLFPLFAMLFWRFGVRTITLLLCAAFFLSFAASVWGVHHKPSATFYLLPFRGWELLVGVFCALMARDFEFKSRYVNNLMSLVGLLAVIFTIGFYDEDTLFPGPTALAPTIGTGLLILFCRPETITYSFLANRLCVGVGLVSYSAYLWHQPALFTTPLYADPRGSSIGSSAVVTLHRLF